MGKSIKRKLPRYPIYVISKGRSETCLTAKFLLKDKVPFRLVIEPQEVESYSKYFDVRLFYILPFSNLGLGSIPARNWVWEHAKKSGADRHWIIDDNIRGVWRVYKGQRVRCESGPAFAAVEDFTDRYENVALSGMNYTMFAINSRKPFVSNCHVYSNILIRNDLPNRWRGRYNEDTDLCLQVLADGWCTILFNAFCVDKMATMMMKGGNTDELYKGNGRLKMARSLERMWPHVVSVDRRFKRPQHVVRDAWRSFTTPLKLKPEVELGKFSPNEYGLQLDVVGEIKSVTLKRWIEKTKK